MGISKSRSKKSLVHGSNSGVYFGHSKVQAQFRDLVVPRQINLTSGRRANGFIRRVTRCRSSELAT